MTIRFVKMHGCGNDYVYIDAINQPRVAALIGSAGWRRLVVRMSDRHKGVGSDGVIALCRPTPAGARQGACVRMRMFNADASEGKMCGNGVRCVAKFAHDRLGIKARPIRVQTGAGVLAIDYRLSNGRLAVATADMGRPGVKPIDAGVRLSKLSFSGLDHHSGIECGPEHDVWIGTFVSMGNPHMVLFNDGNPGRFDSIRALDAFDLARFGPAIERHPAFRDRINIHFVVRQARREATMRTWERGSGITQACGTGACAVLVAGVLTGRLGRSALLHLPGGDLRIRWDDRSGHVLMTGPAEDVFEGEYRA